MKDEHILLSTDGPDCNVLKLKPPMVFTKENVDAVISTLDRILKEVRENQDLISAVTNAKPAAVEITTPNKESRPFKNPIKKEKIKSI